jgi:transcriptional regulator with XRE-family HTH domain
MACPVRVVKELFRAHMALSDAIRLLRSKLGESQEGMARRLGCSTSGYTKWERGVAAPRGEVTIKMLQMCPDDESRAAFGSAIGTGQNAAAFLGQMKTMVGVTEAESELWDNASSAKTAVDALLQVARAGDQNARQLLRDTKDRLSTAVASVREETRAASQSLGEPRRPAGKRANSGVAKGRTKRKRKKR